MPQVMHQYFTNSSKTATPADRPENTKASGTRLRTGPFGLIFPPHGYVGILKGVLRLWI